MTDRLPTEKIDAISENSKTGWLIENIWLKNACGIIGGQPKCCKSWLGLEMAISVATGTPCLKKFDVPEPGCALVFMAEDRVEEVKVRVAHLANDRGIGIAGINLHLITAPVVRLDSSDDCKRLEATLAHLQPKILVLDPLVRLHRLDENSAREISGLLGFLRELERKHNVAIVLTHHASKRANARHGQSLRGSSDLHAFGDSNLYLTRQGQDLKLTVEHRSAPSIDPITLRLVAEANVHLEIIDNNSCVDNVAKPTLMQKILSAIERSTEPIQRNELRAHLKSNNERLGKALQELVAQQRIKQTATGYQLM